MASAQATNGLTHPELVYEARSAIGDSGRNHLPHADRSNRSYQLKRLGAQTDIDLFREALRRAREMAEEGAYAKAAREYREALQLWRNGQDDLAYLGKYPGVMAEFGSLLDERSRAERALLTIEIEQLARYDDSLLRAREFCSRDLADEGAATLLATAYAGSGRNSDALLVVMECIEAVRDRGAQPSDHFKRFQKRLLENWSPRGLAPERRGWRPVHAVEDVRGIPRDASETIDRRLLCPEPSDDQSARTQHVIERIASWALSSDVMDVFDSWPNRLRRPQTASTYRDVFAEMVAESEKWDFRQRHHERWAQLVVKDQEHLRDLVVGAAAGLGMREPSVPVKPGFDIGVSLGGMRLAPLCRTKWLGALADEGSMSALLRTRLRFDQSTTLRNRSTQAPMRWAQIGNSI